MRREREAVEVESGLDVSIAGSIEDNGLVNCAPRKILIGELAIPAQ
jgi:hypothetical protein